MNTGEKALESLHATATTIFRQALADCRIDSAFDRHIQFEGTLLRRPITQTGASPASHSPAGNLPAIDLSAIDLKQHKRIFALAIGKAAVPMLETLLSRMPRRKGLRGICCSSEIPENRNWRIRYFEGGHPLPQEGSFAAARAALTLLRKARKDTLVIFLISGGASALFELPLDPSITLEDTITFHQALIASGAPITEINIIRKHFSAVKGGRLALAAEEATKLSILLPDVPLRSLDTLASGPTYPDSTTIEDARALIRQYKLGSSFPASVNAFFDRENLSDSSARQSPGTPVRRRATWVDGITTALSVSALRKTTAVLSGANSTGPTSGNPAASGPEELAFHNSAYEILLSSDDLVEHARLRAIEAGYTPLVDNTCDDWDYAEAARYLLDKFHTLRAKHPRCCLISGGEVTVTLDRTPGAGGRNQQFALQCALELAKYPGLPLAVFSAGSDGIDGNTRAAGAITDTTTVSRAIAFGYDPQEALATFNACPLLTALGDTVPTGPTGHNLRDLRLLISNPLRRAAD